MFLRVVVLACACDGLMFVIVYICACCVCLLSCFELRVSFVSVFFGFEPPPCFLFVYMKVLFCVCVCCVSVLCVLRSCVCSVCCCFVCLICLCFLWYCVLSVFIVCFDSRVCTLLLIVMCVCCVCCVHYYFDHVYVLCVVCACVVYLLV